MKARRWYNELSALLQLAVKTADFSQVDSISDVNGSGGEALVIGAIDARGVKFTVQIPMHLEYELLKQLDAEAEA